MHTGDGGRGGPCRRCARCGRAPSRRRARSWARSRRRRGDSCRVAAPPSPTRAPAARRGPRGQGAAAPPPASCTLPRPPPPLPSSPRSRFFASSPATPPFSDMVWE
uniref:Uncharacterized protein n=1 Tax=Arundo donax TaxID=35708 RepID=A0A0A9BGW1_ARUDO